MTDWIEQKAERARTQQEDGEKRLAEAREIVDQLEAVVRGDVEKWNAHFRQKIESVTKSMPSGSFKVRKTSFPSATIDATLAPDSSSIEIETTKRRAVGDGVDIVKKQFPLRPIPTGGLTTVTELGQPITLEDISRVLLETIVEGATAPGNASGKK